jgi:hypothetical protein
LADSLLGLLDGSDHAPSLGWKCEAVIFASVSHAPAFVQVDIVFPSTLIRDEQGAMDGQQSSYWSIDPVVAGVWEKAQVALL